MPENAFADLIPNNAETQSGNAFADLIPQPKPLGKSNIPGSLEALGKVKDTFYNKYGNDLRIEQWADRDIRGRPGKKSMHATGEALDIFQVGPEALAVAQSDPNIGYIIHNRQQYKRQPDGSWKVSKYTGVNPHTDHMHVQAYNGLVRKQAPKPSSVVTTGSVAASASANTAKAIKQMVQSSAPPEPRSIVDLLLPPKVTTQTTIPGSGVSPKPKPGLMGAVDAANKTREQGAALNKRDQVAKRNQAISMYERGVQTGDIELIRQASQLDKRGNYPIPENLQEKQFYTEGGTITPGRGIEAEGQMGTFEKKVLGGLQKGVGGTITGLLTPGALEGLNKSERQAMAKATGELAGFPDSIQGVLMNAAMGGGLLGAIKVLPGLTRAVRGFVKSGVSAEEAVNLALKDFKARPDFGGRVALEPQPGGLSQTVGARRQKVPRTPFTPRELPNYEGGTAPDLKQGLKGEAVSDVPNKGGTRTKRRIATGGTDYDTGGAKMEMVLSEPVDVGAPSGLDYYVGKRSVDGRWVVSNDNMAPIGFGKTKAEAIEKAKAFHSKPETIKPIDFHPDQELIATSPDGRLKTTVSYRGPGTSGKHVVFDPKSGMQFEVETNRLSAPNPKPLPSATAPESKGVPAVRESGNGVPNPKSPVDQGESYTPPPRTEGAKPTPLKTVVLTDPKTGAQQPAHPHEFSDSDLLEILDRKRQSAQTMASEQSFNANGKTLMQDVKALQAEAERRGLRGAKEPTAKEPKYTRYNEAERDLGRIVNGSEYPANIDDVIEWVKSMRDVPVESGGNTRYIVLSALNARPGRERASTPLFEALVNAIDKDRIAPVDAVRLMKASNPDDWGISVDDAIRDLQRKYNLTDDGATSTRVVNGGKTGNSQGLRDEEILPASGGVQQRGVNDGAVGSGSPVSNRADIEPTGRPEPTQSSGMDVPVEGTIPRVPRLTYSGKSSSQMQFVWAVNQAAEPKLTRVINKIRGGIGEFIVTDGGKEVARLSESKLSPEIKDQLSIGAKLSESDSNIVYHQVNVKPVPGGSSDTGTAPKTPETGAQTPLGSTVEGTFGTSNQVLETGPRPSKPLHEMSPDEMDAYREQVRSYEKGGAGDPKVFLADRYKKWKELDKEGDYDAIKELVSESEFHRLYMDDAPSLVDVDHTINRIRHIQLAETPEALGEALESKVINPESNIPEILAAQKRMDEMGWTAEDVFPTKKPKPTETPAIDLTNKDAVRARLKEKGQAAKMKGGLQMGGGQSFFEYFDKETVDLYIAQAKNYLREFKDDFVAWSKAMKNDGLDEEHLQEVWDHVNDSKDKPGIGGISNSFMEDIGRSMPDAEPQTVQSWIEKASGRIAQNQRYADEIVEQIEAGTKKTMDEIEGAAVGLKVSRLEREYIDASPERRIEIDAELDRIAAATKKAGTAQARAFAVRAFLLSSDDSLAGMVRAWKLSHGGVAPTAETVDLLRGFETQIKAYKQQIKDLKKKLSEAREAGQSITDTAEELLATKRAQKAKEIEVSKVIADQKIDWKKRPFKAIHVLSKESNLFNPVSALRDIVGNVTNANSGGSKVELALYNRIAKMYGLEKHDLFSGTQKNAWVMRDWSKRWRQEIKDVMRGQAEDSPRYDSSGYISRARGAMDAPFKDFHERTMAYDLAQQFGDDWEAAAYQMLDPDNAGPMSLKEAKRMHEQVKEWGRLNTYNNANVASELTNWARNQITKRVDTSTWGGQQAQDASLLALDLITRFSKVIFNVSADTAKHTNPVYALSSALMDLSRTKRYPHMAHYYAKRAAQSIRKGAWGIGGMAVGAYLYDVKHQQGKKASELPESFGPVLTQSMTYDDKGNAKPGAWYEDQGHLKMINGLFYGVMAGYTRRMIEKSGLSESQKKKLNAENDGFLSNILSNPALGNVENGLTAIGRGDEEETGMKFLARQMIFSGLNEIARLMDRTQTGQLKRNTKGSMVQKLQERVPEVRKKLKPGTAARIPARLGVGTSSAKSDFEKELDKEMNFSIKP